MSYCKECGAKLTDDTKFCHNCGKKVELERETKEEINKKTELEKNNIENSLKCPKCNSNNINAQIVTENKPTGCLTVFLYIILALTIVGIPIMIIILLAKGKKTSSRTVYVCQNCGNTFSKNPFSSSKNNAKKDTKATTIIIILVAIILIVTIAVGIGSKDKEYVDFSEYKKLNIQALHNDYLSNEISAKDKYIGNYYYFTGTVSDITEFLTDKYITLKYTSEVDSNKKIEINAYFSDVEELKKVKKGDKITIYGKFKEQSIKDYMNITTSYTFHSCRIKDAK